MSDQQQKTFIAALQVSLDGYVQGPEGGGSWVDSWADALGLLGPVDAFVLGRGMFEGRYEQYWDAALADPDTASAMFGRAPYPREVDYARLAHETPHIVLSKTMAEGTWPNVQIARDVEELAAFKGEPGRAVYVVGGPGLVAALMSAGLIDELRLIVQPVLLGDGLQLFGGVRERHAVELLAATPGTDGRVNLTYRVLSNQDVDSRTEGQA
jgi:dihydrofolate reductase